MTFDNWKVVIISTNFQTLGTEPLQEFKLWVITTRCLKDQIIKKYQNALKFFNF